MCGRFNFTDEQEEEIKAIIREVSARFGGKPTKSGEVFPTDTVPIWTDEQDGIKYRPMTWGFPKWDGKGTIINARSETVTEKKTFRESILTRRCVIVSTGFYEWSHPVDKGVKKVKYLFRRPGDNVLYMAGFYKQFEGEDTPRFVILTTAPNDSMRDDDNRDMLIHDRMPVILSKNECDAWIADNATMENVLYREGPELVKERVG